MIAVRMMFPIPDTSFMIVCASNEVEARLIRGMQRVH